MKKLLVLMLVLALASVASATVVDLVRVDVGKSGGRLGLTQQDALVASDIIGFKIVLNKNAYPGYTSYDGYMLSSMDLDLHITGLATMDYANKDKSGNPVWQKNAGLSPFVVNDTGGIGNGLDQITGVALTPIGGAADLVWGFLLHCDGTGTVVINLTLKGRSDYSPFKNLAGEPFPNPPGWVQMVESDLGDLTIYQVIPEPMTVALLGLGGLFLRRRK